MKKIPYQKLNFESELFQFISHKCSHRFFSVYPWDNTDILKGLQEWMFLPDPMHAPPAYKLMCKYKYYFCLRNNNGTNSLYFYYLLLVSKTFKKICYLPIKAAKWYEFFEGEGYRASVSLKMR